MNVLQFFNKIKNDKGITLAAAWSFNQLAYAIVYPFIPIYLSQERGIPYSTVSLIFPLMGIAGMLAPIPCGWLTDKCGRRFMMRWGQLGRAIMFFILAIFVYINAPFWVFAVTLMLNTSVGSAFQVGSDAYLTDITTTEERPSYYGKIRIGFNTGWALGPMLGAFFAQTPFWLFFILTGLLCVLGTLYVEFICFSQEDKAATVSNVKKEKNDGFSIQNDVLKNYRFMLMLLGTFLLISLSSQLYSTLSAYATQRVGISRSVLGTAYSLNGFLVLALQLPIVLLFTRIKTPIMYQLIIGTLVYAAGYIYLGFIGGAAALIAAVIIITLGEMISQPSLYTAVSTEAKGKYTGRMLSLYTLTRGAGYAVGPWFGALIFDATKSGIVLWSCMSLFAIAAAVIFLFTTLKIKLTHQTM